MERACLFDAGNVYVVAIAVIKRAFTLLNHRRKLRILRTTTITKHVFIFVIFLYRIRFGNRTCSIQVRASGVFSFLPSLGGAHLLRSSRDRKYSLSFNPKKTKSHAPGSSLHWSSLYSVRHPFGFVQIRTTSIRPQKSRYVTRH